MWYKKRIAIIDDTGEQHQVFTSMNDWDERLYPTMFFQYFSDVQVQNAMTQCLRKFTEDDNGFLQAEQEETEG